MTRHTVSELLFWGGIIGMIIALLSAWLYPIQGNLLLFGAGLLSLLVSLFFSVFSVDPE